MPVSSVHSNAGIGDDAVTTVDAEVPLSRVCRVHSVIRSDNASAMIIDISPSPSNDARFRRQVAELDEILSGHDQTAFLELHCGDEHTLLQYSSSVPETADVTHVVADDKSSGVFSDLKALKPGDLLAFALSARKLRLDSSSFVAYVDSFKIRPNNRNPHSMSNLSYLQGKPPEDGKGTIRAFFPSIQGASGPNQRRLLSTPTPPSRKQPLTAGRTNARAVSAVPGAHGSDHLRRIRLRFTAGVRAPVPRPAVFAREGSRTVRVEALTVEDLWGGDGNGPPYVDQDDDIYKCTVCLQLVSHPVL
ncbi:hypothetical protein DFH09DRAFT_1311760 [Mycena vulgaris]|nr:hypothetical protein DFH09DRAFT_1311760 [Mycena vulgaris]